ncbi:MAG: NADH-ubiquinone oxidoreductase chain K, partial [uncultured Rubrobacteraceae bacterium]
ARAGAAGPGRASGLAGAGSVPDSRCLDVRYRGLGGSGSPQRGRDLHVRGAHDKRREPLARGLRGLSAERRRARGELRRARHSDRGGGNRCGACYSAGRVPIPQDRQRGRSHLDEGL